jgi:hypothetical protein
VPSKYLKILGSAYLSVCLPECLPVENKLKEGGKKIKSKPCYSLGERKIP